MDGEAFDAMVRQAAAGVSRRGIVRASLGLLAALGVPLFGIGDVEPGAEAKNRRRRRRRRKKMKKKKKKNQNTRPAPPPPPPISVCPRGRPIACPTGRCCPHDRPQCCAATPFDPYGSCVELGGSCCTLEQGGGTCPPWLPQCCVPAPRNPRGLCVAAGDTCCTDGGGGYCAAPNTQCCPPTTKLPRGGCCGQTEKCCGIDADCMGGPNPVCGAAGCCVPVTAPLAAGQANAAPRRQGTARIVEGQE